MRHNAGIQANQSPVRAIAAYFRQLCDAEHRQSSRERMRLAQWIECIRTHQGTWIPRIRVTPARRIAAHELTFSPP
jgi:hypothetical protein